MSRLHEIKTKGPDNVMLPKNQQTTETKTVGDRLRQMCNRVQNK